MGGVERDREQFDRDFTQTGRNEASPRPGSRVVARLAARGKK